METYRVDKIIVLGFQTGHTQADALIRPGDRLETDGQTIWLCYHHEGVDYRVESITMANALDVFLASNAIHRMDEGSGSQAPSQVWGAKR